MASADDLKATYSFIAAFEATPELTQYGDNALPLYAVALQLGVDDLGSFATEALTDHPQDKKADIIYIDESDGIACIAQGYVSKDWGKPEAKANKASDLNTAMAWLLQTPIDAVPDVIREQAKLLREGLTTKTIRKIIVAYAHNALESKNVHVELDTVRHLLAGLDISKDADVEVVELGLMKIETLFLASKGAIRVVDQVDLVSADTITATLTPAWNAYTLSLNGATLYALYTKYGDDLFSANLRDFLGSRKSGGNVNNRIQTTVEKNPGLFFVLYNGITIVTKKADLDASGKILHMHSISIVNGAQTTGAIHAAGENNAKNVNVLTRVITVADEKLISEIVAGNNTQNSIVAWDRRSNDPVQVRIAQELEARGLVYVHRRDSFRKAKTSIFADQLGQALCAFMGEFQTAIRAKADIFETEATYNKVFPATLSIGHIFAVQTLSWAYDQLKQNLKSKSNAGGMTDIQTRQLKLLDYPASKQFVISVMGDLREEIAGHKIVDALGFEVTQGYITADPKNVIAAWNMVLEAILPTMTQNLPAEEYQVVRSSEHLQTVAKATKGVVAIPAFQSSFEGLRVMLRP